VLGTILPGVVQDVSPRLHALLKFDRETEQTGRGQLKLDESGMRECQIDRAHRFMVDIPALSGRDLRQ
jgi:hypothetical protein